MVMTPASLTFDDLGTPLIAATFVVLDLETTGLDPRSDAITEVGAVKIRSGEVVGELGTLVQPGRTIPDQITRLTGISNHMVADAPPIGEVLASLVPFCHGATVVAHNAGFDRAFLKAAASRHGYVFDHPFLDTVALARRLLRDEVPNLRLATLARKLGAGVTPDHRALTDARATVDVFHGLLERAGSLGATTVEELVELTRVASSRRFRKKNLVADAPRTCGVYRFHHRDGSVLYIGKATDLRQRLRSYFTSDPRRGMEALIHQCDRVSWSPTPTVLEAEVLELREIHRHQPHFNRRSLRRQEGWFITVTTEALPRLSVVRQGDRGSRPSIGPIMSRRVATDFAEHVAPIFGLRTCTDRLRQRQDHQPCALKELGRCDAPCDGSVSIAGYTKRVEAFAAAVSDPRELLRRLQDQMDAAAKQERYEEAAARRDGLVGVAHVLSEHRRFNAIAQAGRLVVSRPLRGEATATVREVLVVDRGALVQTFVVGASEDDEHLALTSASLPSTLQRDHCPDLVERRLVAAALEGPGVRIISSDQGLCWPATGGRDLAKVDQTARAIRRQTMSNHALSASITDAS